jgi:pSer/pThr/pTyr-binding forkhead associated (FHA) protein/tetratricopeptide (TPR) repeat protein
MKLVIEDDEGRKTVIPIVREEISIGRLEGNTIRLTERNISRHHARLLKQSGAILIEDLGSANGVRVNGERIDARQSLRDGDLIEIGDYDLAIEGLPRTAEAPTSPNVRFPEPAGDKTAVTQRVAASADTDVPRELAPERRPHLMGVAGAFWGQELPLTQTVISFGRAPDVNDIVIDHPSISRTHGKLKLEGGTWTIYDAQSSYGIKVNGRTATATTVQPGDMLEIGQTQFRFCAPGEEYAPPPGRQGNSDETQVVHRPRSKTGLIAGMTVAAAVLSAAAWGVWRILQAPAKAPAAPSVDNYCQKGQAAIDARNWPEAVHSLSVAKQMGTQCAFPLEPALESAQANQDVKAALDDADGLVQQGKFRQIIHSLDHVPPGSVYADAARAKVAEARLQADSKLSLDAQAALDHGHLDEASSRINDLQQIHPEAAVLPMLQRQLSEKKQRAESAPRPDSTTPRPVEPTALPDAVKPRPATVQAETPGTDRNQLAKASIAAGIGLMQKGEFNAGIEKFQAAIAEKPDTDYIAVAHKNIGVGYAKIHKPDDAVTHLKIYLRLKPDAPDRAMIEQLVQQVEAKRSP